MGVQIYRIPQRSDQFIGVFVDGDTININGLTFDLSAADVFGIEIDHDAIVGPVWRNEDGDIIVTVIAPYGQSEAPGEYPATPPHTPPPYRKAQEAIAAMQAWIERAEEQMDSGVSKGERNSYAPKEAEARAWIADNSAATPILSAEAAITGESLTDLVAKVLIRADALRPILGDIAGLRRVTKAALLAEEAKPNFNPATLEAILNSAIAQAVALAAARGITLTP